MDKDPTSVSYCEGGGEGGLRRIGRIALDGRAHEPRKHAMPEGYPKLQKGKDCAAIHIAPQTMG